MSFILNRLRERSTWTGIGVLLTLAGVHFAPDQWQAVVTIGMAIAGVSAAFTPTTTSPVPDPLFGVVGASASITTATNANSGGGAG